MTFSEPAGTMRYPQRVDDVPAADCNDLIGVPRFTPGKRATSRTSNADKTITTVTAYCSQRGHFRVTRVRLSKCGIVNRNRGEAS